MQRKVFRRHRVFCYFTTTINCFTKGVLNSACLSYQAFFLRVIRRSMASWLVAFLTIPSFHYSIYLQIKIRPPARGAVTNQQLPVIIKPTFRGVTSIFATGNCYKSGLLYKERTLSRVTHNEGIVFTRVRKPQATSYS